MMWWFIPTPVRWFWLYFRLDVLNHNPVWNHSPERHRLDLACPEYMKTFLLWIFPDTTFFFCIHLILFKNCEVQPSSQPAKQIFSAESHNNQAVPREINLNNFSTLVWMTLYLHFLPALAYVTSTYRETRWSDHGRQYQRRIGVDILQCHHAPTIHLARRVLWLRKMVEKPKFHCSYFGRRCNSGLGIDDRYMAPDMARHSGQYRNWVFQSAGERKERIYDETCARTQL